MEIQTLIEAEGRDVTNGSLTDSDNDSDTEDHHARDHTPFSVPNLDPATRVSMVPQLTLAKERRNFALKVLGML